VKAAVVDGTLDVTRLESYLKLQDEMTELTRQQDERAELQERRRSKQAPRTAKPSSRLRRR